MSQPAEPFSISLPAISRYLKVLEHAGLIDRGRGPVAPEHAAGRAAQVTAWMEPHRRFWDAG